MIVSVTCGYPGSAEHLSNVLSAERESIGVLSSYQERHQDYLRLPK